jgi:pimeloyl-ACP methyl ester carboxylesterase
MRTLSTFCVFLFLFGGTACAQVETGMLGSASFRIQVGQSWNGTLVVFCGGYNPKPRQFSAYGKMEGPAKALVATGYAVAESGYTRGGWNVATDAEDVVRLVEHFAKVHGQPKRVLVIGLSFGGLVATSLLEHHPDLFHGGVALCTPLAPASWFFQAFALEDLTLFDYYFPNLLPLPGQTGSAAPASAELAAAVTKALADAPEKANALLRYTRLRTTKDLVQALVFYRGLLEDVATQSGGNPFGNAGTVYAELDPVNDGVKRYAAAGQSRKFLVANYTPTGTLKSPLIAVHTTYDPMIPAAVQNYYASMLSDESMPFFTQMVVNGAGHCAFPPDALEKAMTRLLGQLDHPASH